MQPLASRQRKICWISNSLPVVLLVIFTSCSQGKHPMGDVAGTVTFEGQPITWGSLLFSPKPNAERPGNPGKSAVGIIDHDGQYVASTYRSGDGVIVGDHSVRFIYTPDEASESRVKEFFGKLGKDIPKSVGLKEEIANVTVDSGANSINFELVAK